MNETRQQPPPRDPPEKSGYLAVLFLGPTIWAAHFVASYATASIWCARYAGASGSLGPVRLAVGIYTLVALVAIAGVGLNGYRRHRHGGSTIPHDEDTPVDRHRFLGFSTMLLAGLSAIAVLYVAGAALFVATCK